MTENIEVFTQNSIRIKGSVGTIYIDPFQMREESQDADYILLTHDHYDHFSPEDIKKVCGEHTILVVPERMEQTVGEVADIVQKIYTVRPGTYHEIDGLELETIPAYNLLKPFHPKTAEWVGYILRLDGKRIYIAGDTDATKEAKQVKCEIALVPIGGTYTMDAKKAAELINAIRPEVVIPTHYKNLDGKEDAAVIFEELVKPPVKVEVKKQY